MFCKSSCPQISSPNLILGFSRFLDGLETEETDRQILLKDFCIEHVIRAFGSRHSLIILQHDDGGGLVYEWLPFSACVPAAPFVVGCIFSVSWKHNQTE